MPAGHIELTTIAEPLTVVEREGAELKEGLPTGDGPWYLKHAGKFKDDPEFQEIVRLGREIRGADRPQ